MVTRKSFYPRRNARAAYETLRNNHAARRELLCARRAFPASGRHSVRHHRFDHDSILQELRPQPPNRGWALVSVSVRANRDRPSPIARAGATPEELAARISAVWRARTDRGAELRAATGQRGVL